MAKNQTYVLKIIIVMHYFTNLINKCEKIDTLSLAFVNKTIFEIIYSGSRYMIKHGINQNNREKADKYNKLTNRFILILTVLETYLNNPGRNEFLSFKIIPSTRDVCRPIKR